MTSNNHMAWARMESPIGLITVAKTHRGISYVGYPKDQEDPTQGIKETFSKALLILEENERELLSVLTQLHEYFRKKRRQFSLPLDLIGTSFQKQVWRELQNIPYGEVRSYKEIAQVIQAPKASRAVGGANNKNPISIIIPCHRVIGSNGSLVGYGGGLWIKEKLLQLEKEKEAVG